MAISFILSASQQPVVAAIHRAQAHVELVGTGSERINDRDAPRTRPAEETRPAADLKGATVQRSNDLSELVERANRKLLSSSAVISFDVDPDTKLVVTTLIDSRTNEVIRQIPSEAVLEIARSLDKIASVLVDENV